MRKIRPVDVLNPEAVFDRRENGCIYVRSSQPLTPYAVRLTDRLEHWADKTPDQTLLAQRDAQGGWRGVSYSDALKQIRSISQWLLNRGLNAETPIAILSGNSIEHALVAFAAMYIGVPHAPISPSYSLACADLATLEYLLQSIQPAMLFASDGPVFEPCLARVLKPGMELVTVLPAATVSSTAFEDLLSTVPTAAVNEANAGVTADHIAKILFTSGSTGKPKGVITTQRMLCSNQEMLRAALPFLADQPPVLCDWLPWNHVFGGNHNLGIALYNGGTLYIDEGKPTNGAHAITLRNLRDIATTAYFNVPKGFEMLVAELRRDKALRRHFFSRLQMLFYAGAGLNAKVWDELEDLAVDACGEEILMVTGLGATESAPMALCTGAEGGAGRVGLPVPGVELKMIPVQNKLEARLKGPNITPGFWRDPELTRTSFDDEGYYKLGDALKWADPSNPNKGFLFDGRLADDFKLSSGTWVSVGPLRSRLLAHALALVNDVVITAPDRDFVGALVFARQGATPSMLQASLTEFAKTSSGTSTRIERALLMADPPSLEAGEVTDKGTVNQKAVLENRAHLVEELYSGSANVIQIGAGFV